MEVCGGLQLGKLSKQICQWGNFQQLMELITRGYMKKSQNSVINWSIITFPSQQTLRPRSAVFFRSQTPVTFNRWSSLCPSGCGGGRWRLARVEGRVFSRFEWMMNQQHIRHLVHTSSFQKNTYNIAHPIFGKNFKSIPEWIEGKLYTTTVSLEGETMVSQRLSLQSTAGILRYP